MTERVMVILRDGPFDGCSTRVLAGEKTLIGGGDLADGEIARYKPHRREPGVYVYDRAVKTLRRRSEMRRARKQTKRTRADIEQWWSGHAAARCAVTGVRSPDPHHVVTQQVLERCASDLGLDLSPLLADLRNRLWLAPDVHANHHSWSQRIPMGVLRKHCPLVFEFAAELGLVAWLDRNYPDDEEIAA